MHHVAIDHREGHGYLEFGNCVNTTCSKVFEVFFFALIKFLKQKKNSHKVQPRRRRSPQHRRPTCRHGFDFGLPSSWGEGMADSHLKNGRFIGEKTDSEEDRLRR